MHIERIDVAQNGFVLQDAHGNLHIAKTLAEAAQIAGESIPDRGYINYAAGYDVEVLTKVKSLAALDQKIDAIKLLRCCFVPRLGLREARDMVERLCA